MSNSSNYAGRLGRPERPDWGVVTPSEWEQAVRRTTHRLGAADIPVALITDVPLPLADVPSCLSRADTALVSTWDCSLRMSRDENDEVIVAETRALADSPNASAVNMNALICPEAECPTDRDGVIIYSDDNHLTATFSEQLSDSLSAQLVPLLR